MKRGTALVATLFTITIVMVMMALSISLLSYHKTDELRRRDVFLAQSAAASGIEYARAWTSRAGQIPDMLTLNGKSRELSDQQRFKLEAKFKLGYLWVKSTGRSGDTTYEMEAFLGSQIYDAGTNALAIVESKHEMFASGDSRIEGDVLLPSAKLQAKALHKLPAAQTPVVTGLLGRTPGKALPEIKPLLTMQARRMLKQADRVQAGLSRPPTGKTWDLKGQTIKFPKTLELASDLRRIQGPGMILLKEDLLIKENLEVLGDVWIVAAGSIRSSKNLKLGATLVAGRTVECKGKTTGYAAMLARETIDLGPETELQAPSQLGLFRVPEMGATGGQYVVVRGGQFHGTIYTWDEQPWTNPLIKVEDGVDLMGYIYSAGRLELRGELKGHAYTHSLQSSKGAQTFTNWFKNLRIDRAPDDVDWATPLGFSKDVEVIEWVKR